MTFPDENMLAILLHTSDAYGTTDGIQVALTDYRIRTGIDVADVIAKLSAGTHVLMPAEPTYQICAAGNFNWEGGVGGSPPPFPIRYRAIGKGLPK